MDRSDFIYADVPYYPGAKLASYHKRYRQVFASPEVHALAEKFRALRLSSAIACIPVLTRRLCTALLAIGDDHEIYNDFDAREEDAAFITANTAYRNYLGAANPDVAEVGTNYYEFRHGDAAFFVWDTRQYRSADAVSLGESRERASADLWATTTTGRG